MQSFYTASQILRRKVKDPMPKEPSIQKANEEFTKEFSPGSRSSAQNRNSSHSLVAVRNFGNSDSKFRGSRTLLVNKLSTCLPLPDVLLLNDSVRVALY